MSFSNIPNSWTQTLLGAVIEYGRTTKAEPDEIESSAWVLELEDIEKNTSKLLARMTFAERQSRSTKNRFETGDVLYGKLRPYLNKVMIADRPGFCSTEIIPLKTGDHLDTRYLFYWFKHPVFLSYVESQSHGLNMPRLGTEAGKAAPFVLAPLNEQKRIADKLDAVLARVDACRDRLDRIPAILKRFRQSVLAAATSGELTEDWRKDKSKEVQDPIDMRELINLRNSKMNNRGKFKPPILANEVESSEFIELPQSWCRATLDQIVWSVKDGPHYSPKYVESGIPFISGGSIRPEGIDFSIAKFITPELHAELSDRCKPELHNILYTKGGTTGIARVNTETREFNVWVHVAVLKLASTEITNPFFIQHVLNSPQGYIQSRRYTHGVGNQDLGLTRMIKTVIPLPPSDEQTEIVRRVESLFAYADRLEARYTAARAQVDRLTPALLAKAFRGELVPQDPSDEPAGELLARIAAARETTATVRARKPTTHKTIRAPKENAAMTKSRQDTDVKDNP